MPDPIFSHPRLAAVYDALDPDRSDLDVYLGIVRELGGGRVLDIGCGTGTFALLLAEAGHEVVGVDPAAASVAVARAKPGAERVRWVVGDTAAALPVQVDVATLTGNVAQAVVDLADWQDLLGAAHDALRPGGYLVLETRDPGYRGWEEWTRSATYRSVDLDGVVEGVGTVETWTELLAVDLPLVTFRHTWVFGADGAVLTSDSTLRFRLRDEVTADLAARGFAVVDVRDAPDRPGRELVFIARRVG